MVFNFHPFPLCHKNSLQAISTQRLLNNRLRGELCLEEFISVSSFPSHMWACVRAQSCPQLCMPWTVPCQAPLSMEFPTARILKLAGLIPGGLPTPRD